MAICLIRYTSSYKLQQMSCAGQEVYILNFNTQANTKFKWVSIFCHEFSIFRLRLFFMMKIYSYLEITLHVKTVHEEKLTFYLDHFIHGRDIEALACSTRSSYPPQILTNMEKTKLIQQL